MMMSTGSAEPPGPRRKYDNRRRRADAEARQRRIIDAASALFIEQGFGATSIDQIAAAVDVSPESIYKKYGSKAGLLSAVIEVALVGEHDAIAVVDRAPRLADLAGDLRAARFADFAKFIRSLNERVAPLIRVMEQATSSEPALKELRGRLHAIQKADSRHWIDQLGAQSLRPGLSTENAVDVMSMINTPYVYSLLTVDGDMTADEYEDWLAHALPHLLVEPGLLGDLAKNELRDSQ
jgi:AcrR family transcriptional regulator